MSEIKAYKGREAGHIQHMLEKGLSAADLSSVLGWSRAEDLMPELQARPKLSDFQSSSRLSCIE